MRSTLGFTGVDRVPLKWLNKHSKVSNMQLDELKEALMRARINKDKVARRVLQTLIADFDKTARTGKEVDGTALIRKYVGIAKENSKLETGRGNDEGALSYSAEVVFLESLLPKQLTQLELHDIVVHACPSNMGEGMKYLKAKYAGQYDGKVASAVLREFLK